MTSTRGRGALPSIGGSTGFNTDFSRSSTDRDGFRHTVISVALMNGESIHDVAAVHNSSVRVIARSYGHLPTPILQAVAERAWKEKWPAVAPK